MGWDKPSHRVGPIVPGGGTKTAKHVKYQQVISQKRGNPAFQTIIKCIILFVICNKNNGKRLIISTFPGKVFFDYETLIRNYPPLMFGKYLVHDGRCEPQYQIFDGYVRLNVGQNRRYGADHQCSQSRTLAR